MDDIKNNLQEIKEYTMDRLKMPIFFYYFVLLAVWNWDIILLVLKSEASIESIILKIKNDKFESGRYLYPLVIAIGGNIVFPLIMYGIDFPLSWINKGRNQKTSEVELAKAKIEHNIQQERTGSVTLDALNIQLKVLNQDKISLTKALDETSKKLDINENTLEEKNNSLTIKEDEISELKQIVLSYESSIGFYDFSEEINNFSELLQFFIKKELTEEGILTLLNKIFNENNHSTKVTIENVKGYDILLRSKIIREYIDGNITYIKLLPSGIKFMYWLGGMISDQNDGTEILRIFDKIKEANLVNAFENTAINIKKGIALKESQKGLNLFLSLGLMDFESFSDYDNTTKYFLTDIGEKILLKISLKN
ncbi:coiled-coil domain-containing protein [Myroides odoratimimus]|uniref:Uncharacterized protein n=1 Tax=Myroides odoratimimus CIP 101113 TaxID=883154 RepID=A0AAV3F456_9FLAO|nr:hypothetical protein [Myroides odoratimimus]EHO13232.1 hypothetical protein HMPREF9715_01387 [Myroides odoratimimus CIP 101113]